MKWSWLLIAELAFEFVQEHMCACGLYRRQNTGKISSKVIYITILFSWNVEGNGLDFGFPQHLTKYYLQFFIIRQDLNYLQFNSCINGSKVILQPKQWLHCYSIALAAVRE